MSPTMLESIQSSLIPEKSFIPPYTMRSLSIDPSSHLLHCYEIFLDVFVVAMLLSSNVSKNTQTSFLPFFNSCPKLMSVSSELYSASGLKQIIFGCAVGFASSYSGFNSNIFSMRNMSPKASCDA